MISTSNCIHLDDFDSVRFSLKLRNIEVIATYTFEATMAFHHDFFLRYGLLIRTYIIPHYSLSNFTILLKRIEISKLVVSFQTREPSFKEKEEEEEEEVGAWLGEVL